MRYHRPVGPPTTRYRYLTELAADFLSAEGAPRPAAALARRLFAQPGGALPGAAPVPLVRLVEQLLAGDERFAPDGAGNWGLAGWEWEAETLVGAGAGGGAHPLAGAPFAVVGVETTGGRAETHRILEVAVVCLDGGQISLHYTSLVNPLRPVPGAVTELTGITQEMVEEAPTAGVVLEEVRAAIGDRVLVGPNLGADLTFLNYEALWHDLPPFGNPALDTETLAQRLLPDLRRPSLTRVAAALGLTPPLRPRALPDARLTACAACPWWTGRRSAPWAGSWPG
jgi:DNA polymerase III epsilon subunit-like protein